MELHSTGVRLPEDSIAIPFRKLPAGRTTIAVRKGVQNNLLIRTWGGIGDQICSEPTLRYALKHFKDVKITLASELPELFSHLKFHDVYDLRKESPIWDDYICFQTIAPLDDLVWQFANHMVTHCVDFTSICAFRMQLPVNDRVVKLEVPAPGMDTIVRQTMHDIALNPENYVIVHAGRHWPSKTFPADWWNEALESIIDQQLVPILIGKEGVDKMDNQGTVQVDTRGCIDLRNKTSLLETIWLLQQSGVVICNDSSPLHMAVTGEAWVGCIATVKHPDFIFHWRKPLETGDAIWAWRQEALNVGGMWELFDALPNKKDKLDLDQCEETQLRTWLPDPKIIGPWCKEKMDDYIGTIL